MADLPVAQVIERAGTWSGPAEPCPLTYEDRFLRRRVLATETGGRFLLDLPSVQSLNDGDALPLSDGRRVSVVAAPEHLLMISGSDLTRLAWHIGNRHTPCQICDGHLLIRPDDVIKAMLEQLGATVEMVEHPFTPEGGAYGHGRTHSHDH